MPKGSLIFFEVPREEIQSGQVIAFNNKIYDQNGKEDIETVFYRVVSQEGDRFITKEDINQDVVYVSRGDVVGVYLFNIPSYVIWPSLGGVLVLFIGLFGLLVLFKLRRKEEK